MLCVITTRCIIASFYTEGEIASWAAQFCSVLGGFSIIGFHGYSSRLLVCWTEAMHLDCQMHSFCVIFHLFFKMFCKQAIL